MVTRKLLTNAASSPSWSKAHKDFDAKPEKAEFAALTKAQIEDLVKGVKTVANALDKFYNGGSKEIQNTTKCID